MTSPLIPIGTLLGPAPSEPQVYSCAKTLAVPSSLPPAVLEMMFPLTRIVSFSSAALYSQLIPTERGKASESGLAAAQNCATGLSERHRTGRALIGRCQSRTQRFATGTLASS